MKRPLMDEPFTPQPSASVTDGSVMAQVKKRDILLSYPYESMEPFLQLIKEASKDPDVMTIQDHDLPSGKKEPSCGISLCRGGERKRSYGADRTESAV